MGWRNSPYLGSEEGPRSKRTFLVDPFGPQIYKLASQFCSVPEKWSFFVEFKVKRKLLQIGYRHSFYSFISFNSFIYLFAYLLIFLSDKRTGLDCNWRSFNSQWWKFITLCRTWSVSINLGAQFKSSTVSSLNEIARNNDGLLQGTGVYAPSTKPESEQKLPLHGRKFLARLEWKK